MAVLPIRMLPDPVLFQRAKKVQTFDQNLRRLVDDMVDTMRAARGVGLAGNQIGVLMRVAVLEIPEEKGRVRVLVNPEILSRSGKRELEEGCLSYPGFRGSTTRSEGVHVRAQDITGKVFNLKVEGSLLSHALEHEIDHLNGSLYLSRLIAKDAIWKVQEHEPAGAKFEHE